MRTAPSPDRLDRPERLDRLELEREAVARVEAWLAADSATTTHDGPAGRLGGATEAGRGSCRYDWDERGDLIRIHEPDGDMSSYEYDSERRLVTARAPDGAVTRYRYRPDGRLESIESAGGASGGAGGPARTPDRVRRFTYDASGRPASELRGDAGGVVWRYDEQGNVAEVRTAEVSNRQQLDPEGRVTALDQTIDGVTLEIKRAFDDAGRLSDVRLPGALVQHVWDGRGRPERILVQGREMARFEYVEAQKACRVHLGNGVVEESVADPVDSRPLSRRWLRGSETLARRDYAYDDAGRIVSDGARRYEYDVLGRLTGCRRSQDRATAPQLEQRRAGDEDRCDASVDAGPLWTYAYDRSDNRVHPAPTPDAREYRFDRAGQLTEVHENGVLLARFVYDGKGRVAAMHAGGEVERYLYGAADELVAIAGGDGRPLHQFVRSPFGCVAEIDRGRIRYLHLDERQASVLVTGEAGEVVDRHELDPFGTPLGTTETAPWFGGRRWNPAVRLYNFGARWYDPASGRFLTPDTCTAAPDDARIVNPLVAGAGQALLRDQLLTGWLRRPRVRNRYAFCANDPVNCTDPNGHWSFGRVLLTLLGAIWTLPNTVFGLLIEISCLVGEVIRWLVWLVTLGNVSWATPGFDAAASGRLNAFALVFRGGWLGSFSSLLGITFGNVIFVYSDWEHSSDVTTGPDPVAPTAYGGAVTLPRHDALYEHELRHTNQYGWFGPFFHLGLPLFGVYEWDVIVNGYRNAWLERDAREHGGI